MLLKSAIESLEQRAFLTHAFDRDRDLGQPVAGVRELARLKPEGEYVSPRLGQFARIIYERRKYRGGSGRDVRRFGR